MRILIFSSSLIILVLLSACHPISKTAFAIYLLDNEDLSGVDILGKDIAGLTPQDDPLISEQDILSYDPTSHTIELTSAAYQRVQAIFPLPVRVDGIPFVVYAAGEPIYAGAFWTPLSSLSYNGIVILEPMDPQSNSIRIDLGYPGPDFYLGDDPRDNPRVVSSLRAAGKLK